MNLFERARAMTLLLPLAMGASSGLRTAAVDGIFRPLIAGKEPGVAVLIRDKGVTMFQHGYGVTDLRTLRPIGPETNFRLASFTKQFTAMAIMLLVRDGKLSYDSTLSEIFPGFPAYGREISIRQLLTHTSGLPDYEDLMGKEWTAEHQIQDSEVLRLLKRQERGKFAPGTSWAYSNSGYVVLGLVVETVSGESFPEFLEKRVFRPSRMTGSVCFMKGRNEVLERALGHSVENGKLIENDQSATSATLGDGGVYSNLVDLARWDDALRTHALLGAADMAKAWTAVRLKDGSQPKWPNEADGDNLDPGQPVAYGFGWFLDPYRGHARVWHSGSTCGFRTIIDRFAEDGPTVIVLANRTDLDPTKLALETADAYWGKL